MSQLLNISGVFIDTDGNGKQFTISSFAEMAALVQMQASGFITALQGSGSFQDGSSFQLTPAFSGANFIAAITYTCTPPGQPPISGALNTIGEALDLAAWAQSESFSPALIQVAYVNGDVWKVIELA